MPPSTRIAHGRGRVVIEQDYGTRVREDSIVWARQTRAAAVRALAGLAVDADDFRRLADMLGLDPAEADGGAG